MRICGISIYPPAIAGVADYGEHVARHLADDPRVELVAMLANRMPGAPSLMQSARLEVRRVWEVDRPSIGPALLRSLRQIRPDVVWVNLGLSMFGSSHLAVLSGLAVPSFARLLGYPTVVTLHELPMPAALTADRTVVTLERYRRFLAEHYRTRRVVHVPHGAWEQPTYLEQATQETALVFGTFGPHKDPELAIRAIQQLRHARQGARLLLAGTSHPRYPDGWCRCVGLLGSSSSWDLAGRRASLRCSLAPAGSG